MFSFFAQVIGYIETVWRYFTNFFATLLRLIETILTGIELPFELFGLLPSFLGSALIIGLCFGIIKWLLGR